MLKHDQLQNSTYLNLDPINGDRTSILTPLVRSLQPLDDIVAVATLMLPHLRCVRFLKTKPSLQ
ncbi:hypothetical protein [Nostoc sp. UHCC 0252]|uniref:hypothetical protein n=1 Tax=Nostoc sp. UHCC 0252 TaxID=3110241 RepID=UPI002B21C455|nr:hypothetical protein [Nostoc sp. UHCC 0252]MEA5605076.1 hypothetical protein [Nostoc sp. UHCC 0252]